MRFTALMLWIVEPEDLGDVAYIVCQNLKNMGIDNGLKLWAGLFIALSGDLDELFEATNVKSPLNKRVIKKEIEEYLKGTNMSSVFVELNDERMKLRATNVEDIRELALEDEWFEIDDDDEQDEMEEDEDDNATITVEHMEQWRKESQKNLKTKKEFWDAYNTELFNFVNTL